MDEIWQELTELGRAVQRQADYIQTLEQRIREMERKTGEGNQLTRVNSAGHYACHREPS